MANNINIGTEAQLGNWSNYNASTNATVGWNFSEGYVWGNSTADTFSFANESPAVDLFANQAIKFQGGGGTSIQIEVLAIQDNGGTGDPVQRADGLPGCVDAGEVEDGGGSRKIDRARVG